MKIFSNDYNANLPKNLWPTKGGPAKFAKLFSKILINRGHEWVGLVDVYNDKQIKVKHIKVNKNKSFWAVSLAKKYIKDNFTLIKTYKNPVVSGSSLINTIIKILSKENPDIVFINGSSVFAWALLVAAKSNKIPVVTLHAGIWGLEIDLYSDFFTTAGVKVLKKMEKDFATMPTYNVFLNETSKNYFNKYIYKIPQTKVKIIPLPSESGELKISKNKKSKESINVGIVARWDRIKNHKAFLGVAKELIIKNNKYKFFAVTNIPNTQVFKEFKDEYKKNIKVLPMMDRKELSKFYNKMDFMILPSIFDVSPHVVLEAALESVPTFISKNVGYSEIFRDNGLKDFIIDFSNHKKAAKKINEIKNKKYPVKFIKILKNMHNPETVLDKFETLFTNIIS